MTRPHLRPDTPWILGSPSREREELLADLDELNGVIEIGSMVLPTACANTAAAGHIGGIDQEHLREGLIEFLNDQLHAAREWLNNRLEDIR